MIINRRLRNSKRKNKSVEPDKEKKDTSNLSSQRDIITNEQLIQKLDELKSMSSEIMNALTPEEKEELKEAIQEGDTETVEEIVEEKKAEIKEPEISEIKEQKPKSWLQRLDDALGE
jgi:TRAP-type C4-dicarboxylate transport system substrate-binding protein